MERKDAITAQHRRETMVHHHHGEAPLLPNCLDSRHHRSLSLAIEGTGGLIEDEQ